MFGVFRLPPLPYREQIKLLFIRKRAVTAQPEGILLPGSSPNVPLIHTMSSPQWQALYYRVPGSLRWRRFSGHGAHPFTVQRYKIIPYYRIFYAKKVVFIPSIV